MLAKNPDYELFEKALERMRVDSVLFIEQILGIKTLELYQRSLLLDVAIYDKLAIAACHSVGKTYSLALVALWFLYCFEESIVITTAPTHRQVEALLWGEIRKAYKEALYPLGGHLTETKIKISDKHYALGFSPKKEIEGDKEQRGSSFQGFHSLNIMVIFDEATGIPPDIWKMAEGVLTSGGVVKWICIANPTTKNCQFYDCFEALDWKSLFLSCFDSPNLMANGFFELDDILKELEKLKQLPERHRLERIRNYNKPVEYLLSAQWVISKALTWGIDHPLFLSKALGTFPEDSEDVIVKKTEVETAIAREVAYNPDLDKRYIGVDVARFGGDLSVITELIGFKQMALQAESKRDTNKVAGRVVKMIKDGDYWRDTVVLVDGTGIGAGVVDNLRELQDNKELGKHIDIREIHYGSSCEPPKDKKLSKLNNESDDREIFYNLKAKIFQCLADDLKTNLDIMNENVYVSELPSIMFFYTAKGQVRIESKEDYKKRTGKGSPDYSDSLALANYGRHIGVNYGTFKKSTPGKTIVKRVIKINDHNKIHKRIKVTEY